MGAWLETVPQVLSHLSQRAGMLDSAKQRRTSSCCYALSPINCSLENQSPLRVTSMDFIYTIPSPYPPHSYESGMGYSILSFDWNEISYIGSPCVPAAPRPSPLCSPSSPTDPPTGWPHRVRPLFCPHDPSAAETERRVGPGERLCRIPLLLLCAPPSLYRELKC